MSADLWTRLRLVGISVLGDSYAAGITGDQELAWPRLLQRSTGIPVALLAQAGATLDDVARRQVPDPSRVGGGIRILLAGANDILRTPRPDFVSIEHSLHDVLTRLKSGLSEVSLIVLTYPNFAPHLPYLPRSKARVEMSLADLNDLICTTSEELGARTVDLYAVEELAGRENFGPDGLHLSVAGHRTVASVVGRFLQDELEEDQAWLRAGH